MGAVIFLERIPVNPPYLKIYARLGFKTKKTELTSRQKEETDISIAESLSYIALRGVLRREFIVKNDGFQTELTGDLSFASSQLAKYLRGCQETALLGATAGNMIMDKIKEKTAQGNLFAAVVYDATASEMTDAALDWMIDYLAVQLRRENKKLLPRRFSAGYGDFELMNQKIICEKLQMDKIGVSITPSFILLPEKSVTAIAGICR